MEKEVFLKRVLCDCAKTHHKIFLLRFSEQWDLKIWMPLRSSLLRGDTDAHRPCRSQVIIFSPISKQESRADMLNILLQTASFSSFVLTGVISHKTGSQVQMQSSVRLHISLYIPLREVVLASLDNCPEFPSEPSSVASELVQFYHRCLKVTWLKIASINCLCSLLANSLVTWTSNKIFAISQRTSKDTSPWF